MFYIPSCLGGSLIHSKPSEYTSGFKVTYLATKEDFYYQVFGLILIIIGSSESGGSPNFSVCRSHWVSCKFTRAGGKINLINEQIKFNWTNVFYFAQCDTIHSNIKIWIVNNSILIWSPSAVSECGPSKRQLFPCIRSTRLCLLLYKKGLCAPFFIKLATLNVHFLLFLLAITEHLQ